MDKVIRKNNKGFSIVEAVVAIYIITMGLIGVLTLVIKNIQVKYINTNMLVASQLAQEGLELVRNIRDTNWLDENDWYDSIYNQDPATGDYLNYTYTITFKSVIDDSVNIIDNARMTMDGNFYSHGLGAPSSFYRLITVSDGGEFLVVESQVRWQTSKGNHDYIAETYLYDWR